MSARSTRPDVLQVWGAHRPRARTEVSASTPYISFVNPRLRPRLGVDSSQGGPIILVGRLADVRGVRRLQRVAMTAHSPSSDAASRFMTRWRPAAQRSAGAGLADRAAVPRPVAILIVPRCGRLGGLLHLSRHGVHGAELSRRVRQSGGVHAFVNSFVLASLATLFSLGVTVTSATCFALRRAPIRRAWSANHRIFSEPCPYISWVLPLYLVD